MSGLDEFRTAMTSNDPEKWYEAGGQIIAGVRNERWEGKDLEELKKLLIAKLRDLETKHRNLARTPSEERKWRLSLEYGYYDRLLSSFNYARHLF